jgi:hypothetical protein
VGVVFVCLVAIAIIVGLVRESSQREKELSAAAKNQCEYAETFVSGISHSRDTAKAAEISTWLQTVEGLNQREALEVFLAVSAEDPEAPLRMRMAITEALAPVAVLRPKPGELRDTARVAGTMHKLMPEKSAEAVVGLSVRLQEFPYADVEFLTGDMLKKIFSELTRNGAASPEEALAQIQTAREADGKMGSGHLDALLAAARAINRPYKIIEPH